MKITYTLGSTRKSSQGEGQVFLSANGGFFWDNPESSYGGWFIRDGLGLVKVLDKVVVSDSQWLNEVVNSEGAIKKGNINQSFSLHENRFFVEFNKEVSVDLVFDVRRGSDYRNWGREYSIDVKDGKTIITFMKKTDNREDSGNEQEEFSFFIVINEGSEVVDKWIEQDYAHDASRNVPNSTRWVYHGVKFKTKKLVMSCSNDLSVAMKLNDDVNNKSSTEKSTENTTSSIEQFYATRALQSLVVEDDVYAGHPWFDQFWSRDSLISLGGFLALEEYSFVKKLLFKLLRNIQEDGLLPNRLPHSDLASADSIGWLFKRFHQLIEVESLDCSELSELTTALEKSLLNQLMHHTQDGLAVNGAKETWMDTTPLGVDDVRSGARIEIQALRLAQYKLAYVLTKQKKYMELEEELKIKVREKFFDGKVLFDGAGDSTQRPNIFIAYYVYPELLSSDEWKTCFSNALKELWLSWGGLSTISTKHPLFTDHYTGMDNRSYHRGDSWYWVNNVAAISLNRVDAKKFGKHVKKIYAGSRNDLLFQGALGYASELSSAKKQQFGGTVNQAWSNATFLELVKELEK